MPSLRTKQMRLLALLALPITWFILLSGRWTRSPAADVVSMANYYSHPLTITSKERFVRAIMDKPVLHKFHPTEIQAYCSKQTWPEDLVLECHGIIGGIGSVRQQIFTCVRWAMATGTAILIPRPHPRRQTNSTLGQEVYHKYSPNVELEHFFDTEGFKKTMHTMCPQMKLYDNLDNEDSVVDIGEFKLHPKGFWTEKLYHKTSQKFLNNHKSNNNGSLRFAFLGRHFKESLVCEDGEGFTNAMGHLLQTRKDIMRLVGLVLYEMSVRFNIDMDPSNLLAPGGFAGIHLRTSSDAMVVSNLKITSTTIVNWYTLEGLDEF